MNEFRSRRFAGRIALVLVFVALFYNFSPWTVVVQRRGGDLQVGKPSSNQEAETIGPPTRGELDATTKEEIHKKDDIEENFGTLEEAFLNSVGRPASPPKSSRDDSIRLMYGIKQTSDWMSLIDNQDEHGFMPLTKIVQRYIFEKQNPKNCEGQKFLILNKFPGDDAYGLGAIVQHISDYLAVAIQTNSILLYNMDLSPGEHFISEPANNGGPSCGRSFDCVFQKLSHCTSESQKGMDRKLQSIFTEGEEDLDVEAFLKKHPHPIPPVFEKALKKIQPDITGEMLKYWWRAQGAAYIMRFNTDASRRLKELRLGTDTKQLGIQWDTEGNPNDVKVPFPMPEGTISIHVRHGDKGSEMRLVPFNDYVVRSEKFSAENPLGSWKRAFLSTEDPNVIEQMKSMPRITPFSYSGSNSRWTWYWSDIPRLNTGPETQLKEFGNRTDLTLKWILQLSMAIECDVFVGTRGSGWNRLIDSLRCIWLASCKQPFLEVGFDNDWAGYGP